MTNPDQPDPTGPAVPDEDLDTDGSPADATEHDDMAEDTPDHYPDDVAATAPLDPEHTPPPVGLEVGEELP